MVIVLELKEFICYWWFLFNSFISDVDWNVLISTIVGGVCSIAGGWLGVKWQKDKELKENRETLLHYLDVSINAIITYQKTATSLNCLEAARYDKELDRLVAKSDFTRDEKVKIHYWFLCLKTLEVWYENVTKQDDFYKITESERIKLLGEQICIPDIYNERLKEIGEIIKKYEK